MCCMAIKLLSLPLLFGVRVLLFWSWLLKLVFFPGLSCVPHAAILACGSSGISCCRHLRQAGLEPNTYTYKG